MNPSLLKTNVQMVISFTSQQKFVRSQLGKFNFYILDLLGIHLATILDRHLLGCGDHVERAQVLQRRHLPGVGPHRGLGPGGTLRCPDPTVGHHPDILLPLQGQDRTGGQAHPEVGSGRPTGTLLMLFGGMFWQSLKTSSLSLQVRRAILDEQQGISRNGRHTYDNHAMGYEAYNNGHHM